MARKEFFYPVSIDGLAGYIAERNIEQALVENGYTPETKRNRRFFRDDDGTLIVEINVPPSNEAIAIVRIAPGLWNPQPRN